VKIFKFIIKWGFIVAIWLAIIVSLICLYYFKSLPDLKNLEPEKIDNVVEINYSNNQRITNYGEIYTDEASYYELPKNLINAVVATEDRRFFSHFGIDIFGILRAFYVNNREGRIVQGGSTITQQLAKLLFLTPDRTIKRKIQEFLLAIQLERRFSKEQILTFYLNRAYFGSGNYGVKMAAKNYFNKNVASLNLNESAIIAGLLKAPSKYSPKNDKKLAESRANIVLSNMIDAGFVTIENVAELDDDASYNIDHSQRLYFANLINKQYQKFLNKKALELKTLQVRSTLDEEIQESLENILDKFIKKNNKKIAKSQIAIIIMDKDGAIKAMSGGKDYQKSQYNRAIYAKRQPGSAFKTIVYLSAFEHGYNKDDVFDDKKVNFGTWLPQNYNNKYFGKTTLKDAFAKSLNSVAIQLGKEVGLKNIVKTARSLGIVSKIDQNDLSIILGTPEISLLEMTTSYAVIANDGNAVFPYMILDIKDESGNILYKKNHDKAKKVISKKALLEIKELLQNVVENGTGSVISKIGGNKYSNIYGKTGTSQNFQDAWFVGFDKDYVIGVWIGNDDNSPTNKISGGSLPARLFGEILDEI